jgi:hypothetical protein
VTFLWTTRGGLANDIQENTEEYIASAHTFFFFFFFFEKGFTGQGHAEKNLDKPT